MTPPRPTPAPWHGWAPLLVLPAAVIALTPGDVPRWAFMWLLAVAIFAGCKWLTWRRTPAPGAPWWRHAGYLLAWPGLDAAAFLRGEPLPPSQRPTAGAWAFAAVKLAAGVAILWLVLPRLPEEPDLLRGWVGMVGIIFCLHFGVMHLASCAWRSAGVEARPLMDWPAAATSVSEFWGRRWNTAFRDLAHRFLFRPLAARLGPRRGLAAGFVFSGVVHELAISVPAGAGYGLPTAYFCLQAVALFVERSKPGRAVGLGSGWRGWLFTAMVLLAPAGLLFHPPFVREVVLPFLEVVGTGD